MLCAKTPDDQNKSFECLAQVSIKLYSSIKLFKLEKNMDKLSHFIVAGTFPLNVQIFQGLYICTRRNAECLEAKKISRSWSMCV